MPPAILRLGLDTPAIILAASSAPWLPTLVPVPR